MNLYLLYQYQINSFGMSKLLTLDVSDEESVQQLLVETDYAIQWGDNLEADDHAYD